MRQRPCGYVYALHKAFWFQPTKSWHPNAGQGGKLFQALVSAQAQIDIPWVKDARRNIWRTANHDIITKEPIYP